MGDLPTHPELLMMSGMGWRKEGPQLPADGAGREQEEKAGEAVVPKGWGGWRDPQVCVIVGGGLVQSGLLQRG